MSKYLFKVLIVILLTIFVSCEKEPFYGPTYKKLNTGNISFEIPEVLELSEIAMSLTNYNDKKRVGQYWQDVETHFGKYRTHPLIVELNKEITNFNADYDLRMGAFAHEFSPEGKIVEGFYPYSKFGDGKNRFKGLVAKYEDFAKQSDFRNFYKNQLPKYDLLKQKQAELMPVKKMWDWLEERFEDKSQSYKIIFSPLFGGNHNTVWFSNHKFRESIFFVSFVGENNKDQSQKVKEGLANRIIFTEIDHNYVNPLSEKCKREINKVLKDWKKWNKTTQGYNSPILTFNEYMTWVYFSFYAFENYGKADFELIIQITEDFMSQNRGFNKFKSFNQYMLAEYKKDSTLKPEKVYELALDWMDKN